MQVQQNLALRSLGAARWVGALCVLSACNPYDLDIRFMPSDSDAGSKQDASVEGGMPDGDSSVEGGTPCTMSMPEVCNGQDDNCDGIIDNKVAAQLDCESRILHADSACESGTCLRQSECYDGYLNCDGDPSNGCEPKCDVCGICEDAGADDGGLDGG